MPRSHPNPSGRAVVSARRTANVPVGKQVRAHSVNGGGSWPSSLSMLDMGSEARPASADYHGGLGITEFLGGKNFFITGGTGFLGKVLIEKILRTNPDIGKIYVLIKARDAEAAMKRLHNEVVDKELFKCLQEIRGEEFNSFVARKLVPVIGDIRDANLGICPELMDEIAESVDIIVNSAGNTNFHERYDVAMDINTLGPFRMMSFAQRFRRLKLFLHVSTAYVNGRRQGVVPEKPFRLGDTIAMELGSLDSSQHEKAWLDIEAEIQLAMGSGRQNDDSPSFCKEMIDLGLQRPNLHGWQDTYVFTKALGEMVINCMLGEIPVVIIRPSVIESTLSEPFPGWIQGNRMADPVILYYGKGQIRSFVGNPDCVLDVIPADIVVNATLASMAKGVAQPAAAGMHVYHVASSTVNPMLVKDIFQYMFHHFTRSPLIDASGKPIPVQPIRFCQTMEEYSSSVEANELLRSQGRGTRAIKNIIYLGRMFEPYTFYCGLFDNANTEALLAEMSAAERPRFHFDVRTVDWMDYFTNVHIPGLKKHVMKSRGVRANPIAPSTTVSDAGA